MKRFSVMSWTIGITAVMVAVLAAMGRVWVSATGTIMLWVSDVGSSDASQQITDWYSASHFIHGILFFGFLYLFRRYLSFGARFVIAVVIECGWEILEIHILLLIVTVKALLRSATLAIVF